MGERTDHIDRTYDDKIPFKITKCSVPKTIALTYDDGPSDHTEAVLDVLEKHNARGTFFLGGNINGRGPLDSPKWQPVIMRMFHQKHQVGSHTWSHINMDKASTSLRREELMKNEGALLNVLGHVPTYMRAPYIACGQQSQCEADVKNLGYHLVTWQYDSEDWKNPRPSSDEALVRLLPAISGQSEEPVMIIQHDTHQGAVDLTDALLRHLPADWRAVTMAECLGQSIWTAYREVYRGGLPSRRHESSGVRGKSFLWW